MTLFELLSELDSADSTAEVYVVASNGRAYRLLGVFVRGQKIYLDSSVEEKDSIEVEL